VNIVLNKVREIRIILPLIFANIISLGIIIMIILDDEINILFGAIKAYYLVSSIIFGAIIYIGTKKKFSKLFWRFLLISHFVIFFIALPGWFLHAIGIVSL